MKSLQQDLDKVSVILQVWMKQVQSQPSPPQLVPLSIPPPIASYIANILECRIWHINGSPILHRFHLDTILNSWVYCIHYGVVHQGNKYSSLDTYWSASTNILYSNTAQLSIVLFTLALSGLKPQPQYLQDDLQS